MAFFRLATNPAAIMPTATKPSEKGSGTVGVVAVLTNEAEYVTPEIAPPLSKVE